MYLKTLLDLKNSKVFFRELHKADIYRYSRTSPAAIKNNDCNIDINIPLEDKYISFQNSYLKT